MSAAPYVVTVTYNGTGTAFEPQTCRGRERQPRRGDDLNVTVRAISVQETVTVVRTN
ncbi:MAG: hypothetical protein R2712_23300 [Vicinamibacterales bacterium]